MSRLDSPPASTWNVLIVEDEPHSHELAVLSVQAYLEASGRTLGQLLSAYGLREARARLLSVERLDLVVLDLALPDGWGHELIEQVLATSPLAHVIVHTVFDDDANLLRALALGAGGYVLKGADHHTFARLLGEIEQGSPPLSPSIARRMLQSFRQVEPHPLPPLTPKEFEVLQFLARGLTNAEAAACLGISTHTVCSHVKSIYRKLQVSTRAEMTGLAQRNGWVGSMTT